MTGSDGGGGVLEAGVLGPLRLQVGDRSIELGGNRGRTLLALLLLYRGEPVPFDWLPELVYDGRPPANWCNSIQSIVSRLRRQLADAGAPPLLRTERRSYLLDLPAEQFDAARFERLATEGAVALAAGDAIAAADRLATSLALWRGEAYGEVEHLELAAEESRRLEELRIQAIEDRYAAELAAGRHARLVADLTTLSSAYPERERLHALLMLALYRVGRQAEALEVFQRVRRRLRDLLGMEPGRELRELQAAILRQEEHLLVVPPVATRAASIDVPPAADFVGRADELSQAGRLLDQALGNRGAVLLVTGQAGIGKTRLAEELARRAADLGFAVHWGRCVEGTDAQPLRPWRQILERLGRTAPTWAPVGRSPGEIGRVAEAIARAVADATAGRPHLLVLDDAQWADDASRRVLSLVARDVTEQPLVVVATVRTSGRPVDPSVWPLWPSHTSRIELQGLPPEDVGGLVRSALGRPVEWGTIEALHGRTGGSPFLLREVLAALPPHVPDADDALLRGVPAGASEMIGRQFDDLPTGTREALRQACLLGDSFELSALAAVIGRDAADVLGALEPAVESGLLEPDPGEPGSLRFRHALLREAIAATLPPARRRAAHAAIAEALRRRHGRGRWAEIARHLEQALPLSDVGDAIRASVMAADEALSVHAFPDVEEHLRRALMICESHPADPEVELDLLNRLVDCLTMTGGYTAPDVLGAGTKVRRAARSAGSTAVVVPALWSLWSSACVRGDFPRTRHLTRELLTVAASAGPAEQAIAAQAAGTTAWHLGRLDEAATHLERSRHLLTSLEPPHRGWTRPQPEVAVPSFLALVDWLRGDRDRARELAGEALDAAEANELPYGRAFAAMVRAWLGVLDADADEAAWWGGHGRDLAESFGFVQLAALAGLRESWGRAMSGEEAAADDLGTWLHRLESSGVGMLRHVHLGMHAQALAATGRVAEAAPLIDGALRHARVTGEECFVPHLQRLRRRLLVVTDD